jgi:hypothetical protein
LNSTHDHILNINDEDDDGKEDEESEEIEDFEKKKMIGNMKNEIVIHRIDEILKVFSGHKFLDVTFDARDLINIGKKEVQNAYHDNEFRLNVSEKKLNFEEVKLISKSFENNNHLEKLSFVGNHIGDKGFKEILNSLKLNTSLQKIYFSSIFNN